MKYAVYEIGRDERRLVDGCDADTGVDIGAALERIAAELDSRKITFDAVGQRVVFGGAGHDAPTECNEALLAVIEGALDLFPMHLPQQLESIRFIGERYRSTKQVLCFDTAFHSTMPALATRLPLAASLGPEIRRYGFHGLSYEYIVNTYDVARRGKVVIAHLGSGASLCALRDGKSVDTTMGISALGGLMMATRPGDLDPGVILYLLRRGFGEGQIRLTLNRKSGLLGVSELSADARVLEERYGSNERATLAIDLFCYIACKQLGSMAAALAGLEALIFTGGIGEHSALVRSLICERLRFAGVSLDRAKNETGDSDISAAESRVRIHVFPTNENLILARHTYRVLTSAD